MSQIPPLPLEVVEKIIDCVALQSNKSDRTLWNCALASRAFRIRSQFHIHGSISIPNLLDESCIFRHYRGSQLASYVRKLSIAGGLYDGDGFFKSRWIPFLDLFPMLKVVDLNNVKHRLPPSPEYQSPLYPSVTSLVLWQIYVPTCQTILSILATMPNLSTLSLVQSSCQWRCEGASLIPLPVIRELEISCTEGVEELACLISHLDFSDAKKVGLHWYGDKELRQVKMDSGPVLDLVRAAASLQEVYFGIRFFPPFRVVPGHISLSQNTNLETLIIGIVYLVWEPFGVPDFGWLPDTLEDIASTCFRQFKIQIRIENTTQFSYIPWGRIDGILSCPEFPSFRQLTIELCSRSSMPWRGLEYEGELSANEVLPIARRYLPNLAARGALTVIETPPS